MINPNYNITLAFFLGITLRTLTNPWILGYSDENYSIHKNKIYDSILFGSMAGLIQIMIDSSLLNSAERFFWIILFITIAITLNYTIRKQLFINGDDLLFKLKENYGESIKFSDIQLSNKNINEELKNFLLVQNAQKQKAIDEIKQMLNKKNNNS
jgi:hypothetical protein